MLKKNIGELKEHDVNKDLPLRKVHDFSVSLIKLTSLFCFSSLLSFSVISETLQPDNLVPDEPSLFSLFNTEVEFGYDATSGNENEQAIESGLSAEYTEGRNRFSGSISLLLEYEDNIKEAQQYDYNLQNDYRLSQRFYIYGNYDGAETLYSSYFSDHTLSSGLGYLISDTENFSLEFEIGPGFRYQVPNQDEIDDDDLIFPDVVNEGILRTDLSFSWDPISALTLESSFTSVSGASNTRIDSSFDVAHNLTEVVAIKYSYENQYHTKVPEGLNKTDDSFSINLLFSF